MNMIIIAPDTKIVNKLSVMLLSYTDSSCKPQAL